jgi:methyltransferase (TIGR00027 family)
MQQEAPMTEKHGSRTALGVAWLRAAHQVIDSRPLILEDPAIVDLLGRQQVEQALAAGSERAQSPGARALRAHVVLRSRYTEDRLEQSLARGVRQFVILGAGYDTFIARQPDWAKDLRVFEVDHPATQAEKQSRLIKAGLRVPLNVVFADVDFELESLADGLRRHGVSFDVPTFFSWLGVSMYLTETAVDAVLSTVAQFPKGSEISFTFAQPVAVPAPGSLEAGAGTGTANRAETAGLSLAEAAAALGEPWKTYFEVPTLERKLRTIGFADTHFLTVADSAKYFAGRADGLPAPRRISIVSAMT